MRYGPGAYLTHNNRFAQLLARQPNVNNGTHLGGLSSALRQGMMGYAMGRDRQDSQAANQALMQGLNPGQMHPSELGDQGGIDLARQNLAAMSDNPYAQQMGMDLMLRQMARDAEIRKIQDQRSYERAEGDRVYGRTRRDKKEDRVFDRETDLLKRKYDIMDALNELRVKHQFDTERDRAKPYYDIGVEPPSPRGMPQASPMGAQSGSAPSIPTVSPPPAPGASPASTQEQPKTLLEMQAEQAAAIEGAKAQAKSDVKQDVESREAAAKFTMKMGPLDDLAATVDMITGSAGIESRTGYSSYIPAPLQGSEAINTQALMKNLRSKIAQNVLQLYREMSQTGGAVGQVSNFEQQMFINNLAALDQAQTQEQFVKQLGRIKEFVSDSKARMMEAYQMQFGKQMPGAPQSGFSIRKIEE